MRRGSTAGTGAGRGPGHQAGPRLSKGNQTAINACHAAARRLTVQSHMRTCPRTADSEVTSVELTVTGAKGTRVLWAVPAASNAAAVSADATPVLTAASAGRVSEPETRTTVTGSKWGPVRPAQLPVGPDQTARQSGNPDRVGGPYQALAVAPAGRRLRRTAQACPRVTVSSTGGGPAVRPAGWGPGPT